jgi:hypothetical protein
LCGGCSNIFDFGAVLEHEDPLPLRHATRRNNIYRNQQMFRRASKKTIPVAVQAQRRAPALQNPKFRCLGTKHGAGSAKLPTV